MDEEPLSDLSSGVSIALVCRIVSGDVRPRLHDVPGLEHGVDKGISLLVRLFRKRDAASCELCPSLDIYLSLHSFSLDLDVYDVECACSRKIRAT